MEKQLTRYSQMQKNAETTQAGLVLCRYVTKGPNGRIFIYTRKKKIVSIETDNLRI